MDEKRSSVYCISAKFGNSQPDANHVDLSSASEWTKCRITKNLLVLSFGFLFLFTGFNGVATLQSTMNKDGGIGVASQAIIYAAFSLSSLLLPKVMIKNFGCKKVLVYSMLAYIPYVASNFYPRWWNMVPASLIIGTAAATLWSSQSTYLNRLGRIYCNRRKHENLQSVTALLFGAFGMFYMSTNIWGNLISYFILREDADLFVNHTSTDMNVTSVFCGIDYSEVKSEKSQDNIKHVSDSMRYLLSGIYVLCVLGSILLVAILLDKLPEAEDQKHLMKNNKSNLVVAAFNHMKNRTQQLLIIITFYQGLSQGFFTSDFTKAYVACSWGVYHVGLVALCGGVVSSTSSVVSGRLVKYFGRPGVMLTFACVNATIFILLFTWNPIQSSPIMFMLMGGLFGYSYGVLWAQARAFYGLLFYEDEEAAFGNFTVWTSLGYCLSFGYSNYVNTNVKVYVLLTSCITGLLGYLVVEVRLYRSKSSSAADGKKNENHSTDHMRNK